MTRILCVTANYPPHHLGGYEVSCRDVMDRLVDRGHHVTVLTSTDRVTGVEDPPAERAANPAVWRDLIRYFRDDQLWAPRPWVRWRVERHNRDAVAAVLAASRPDVAAVWHVGAFSLGVVTALIEAGLPIVYGISDDWLSYCTALDQWTKLMDSLGPVAKPLRRVLRVPTVVPDLGRSGVFAFISESTRERAEEYARWTFPRSTIVYSGIDRSLFTADGASRPWGWRLLYVGRYDARKGIETVVRAMAHLPEAAMLEVQGTGDDAERGRLEALARELGVADRIRFARVPRSELPERYRASDVFIFPSEWYEPFGLVPLEAMACATPVVATGVGGSGEFLVHERNCLRFDKGDPVALAAAIERVAGDPSLRAALVASGLRTAEYFDVEHLTDEYEALHDAAARGDQAVDRPGRRFDIDEVERA